MTPLAAYLLLFVAVGIGFIFVHLMAGKLIRPNRPDPAKRTIYECGEPTIGSSWIQFDLRFYVVALLFVIFDVEVAFFFPWAVVFGKANTVAALAPPQSAEDFQQAGEKAWELVPPAARSEFIRQQQHENLLNLTEKDVARLNELKGKKADGRLTDFQETQELDQLESNERAVLGARQRARVLSWAAFVEIAVFFGVLLVGFAYLWRRGDLAWVRSLAAEEPVSDPAAQPRAAAVVHS
jgi:NADH-quinone oxidoreductase subunit A